MEKELDCRGMECPAPVLHVRNTVENNVFNNISVLVDNDAAGQNVSRFLKHRNYQVQIESAGDFLRVVGTLGEGGIAYESPSPKVVVSKSGDDTKKIMILVTGTNMGHGDDALGDMLMFNFLKTLKEIGPELWRVVFVNSGVSFTAEGSDAVPILQELSDSGVKITACGACLAFFHILDKLQVAEVTNMLEIVTSMNEADSVITI